MGAIHEDIFRFPSGATFINRLDYLEWQTNAGNLLSRPVIVVLSGPNQFRLRDFNLGHLRHPPRSTGYLNQNREGNVSYTTWIRREFHCFRWKLPENRRLSPQCLQQSIDFHQRSFNPPGVLIYEPGAISPAPTFG